MRRYTPPEYIYDLEVGDILHVNGLPYSYIGNGQIAGHTDPYIAPVGQTENDQGCNGERCLSKPCACGRAPEDCAKERDRQRGEALNKIVQDLRTGKFAFDTHKFGDGCGGLRLDDGLDSVVFGPGPNLNNTRIGDGCCTNNQRY